MKNSILSIENFGYDFKWGVSTSAAQIEGSWNVDGKGPSIWDTFSANKNKIKNNDNLKTACNHYQLYEQDLSLIQHMGISNYRFSLSWPRIFSRGYGEVNQKGIDFYNRLIDGCIEKGITPWATLYHWDLPQALEDKGGWMNRDTMYRFVEYSALCAHKFGDRLKHIMTINEPVVCAGAGYFLGVHAPGKRGAAKFIKAVHHLALSQAEAARAVKEINSSIEIGTTFSCSYVQPLNSRPWNIRAAKRVDAMMNRLFIEPLLGLGYPLSDLPFLSPIEEYFKQGDDERLKCDMDFIGIQNYTREIIKHSLLTPYLHASLVKADKREVETTAIGWEVFPESVYHMLKKFGAYKNIKKIIVTESGIALHDQLVNGQVCDYRRIDYLQSHLAQVLRAKNEGVKVDGFFVWTLLDNFEWAEGYDPRFGLVHVNFETQTRTLKKSGYWYKKFLSGNS